MNSENMHPPAILLLGENSVNGFVKAWFEKSRFHTVHTADISRVLEEISDFTVARPPDVILFESSLQYDFTTISELVQTSSPDSNLPIFALLKSGNFVDLVESFEGNLTQLHAKLDEIIPQRETYRAAV